MKFYIKQKVFSFGDKFSIYDENGNERYFVKGEVFSFGKKLHLFDLGGNELAFIAQKVFSFLPTYRVFRYGNQVAEVVRNFTFFRQEYTVKGPSWHVQGDFLSHEFALYDNERQVAAVSKEWFTWGDTYAIDIADDADVITALSVVLILDAVMEQDDDD